AAKPMSNRSLSEVNTKTGTSRSRRIRVGDGAGTSSCGACDSGAPDPARLCRKKPSYTRSRGCNASTYVVRRVADCDCPTASSDVVVRPPSTLPGPGVRTSRPTWEKTSYE